MALFNKTLIEDTLHWQSGTPPLSPNEEEISIYSNLINNNNSVYLLGMTKGLMHLCNLAIDLNPIEVSKPTLKLDWNDLDKSGLKADVFIGDGILNLMGLEFVDKILKISNRFIVRVFEKKLIGMKYATIFPNEFPNSKLIIPTQKDISIVMWEK